MSRPADTLALAIDLLGRASITPADAGCADLIASRLAAAGFTCERLDRGGVTNLWARRGAGRPLVCFAGHTDVVPPGPLDRWTSEPFRPTERDGLLYARGASDMKGPLAAAVTAIERFVSRHRAAGGSIALLTTSDEEGDAVDGTAAVVDALRSRREHIDHCIVVEPSSTERLGDTIKHGRRGSLSGALTVRGVQCHIAYPHLGRNPVHLAAEAIAELVSAEWDHGDEDFPPTSFQISNVHAGTGATNVVPGTMSVLFNFRFSPASTAEALQGRVRETLDRHGLDYDLEWTLSGTPFLTRRGTLTSVVSEVIGEITGVTPVLSTGGGTSDARFLAAIAGEIVEFGPSSASIHKVDEHIRIGDLDPLSAIYERVLERLLL
ncbi:MAG: succinyl-diaminopimelate desuccinylase [Acidobacteria bacterium]|nr:succinyl-diaminopimelate desuccinylase [Acidobacteriota bacterium]